MKDKLKGQPSLEIAECIMNYKVITESVHCPDPEKVFQILMVGEIY
jgi:hypothetical protein